MPAPKTSVTQAQEVYRPVLLRGLTALGYAAISIFWFGADQKVLSYSTAGLLVLTGVFMWQYASVNSAPVKARGLYAFGAGIMLMAGITMLFASTPAMVAYLAAAGLIAAGIAEIAIFVKYRAVFPPYRNQLISGAVAVLVGAALLFAGGMDIHGVLGLIGGSAIVFAVFELIAAFGHRHDSRKKEVTAEND
ncbi:DUF308 domain-containing protein [Glutamicibacter uratoxydans]|uniref:DUF308 domain-containing protein n=1 Tax=Glutamicibacter uratoxydans TaxID=43667 RepID=UPI003D6EF66D